MNGNQEQQNENNPTSNTDQNNVKKRVRKTLSIEEQLKKAALEIQVAQEKKKKIQKAIKEKRELAERKQKELIFKIIKNEVPDLLSLDNDSLELICSDIFSKHKNEIESSISNLN